jgi:gluconate kinase
MATQNYKQVIVHCTDLNKDAKADVIHQTDDMLKVVFVGSTTTMTLHRKDNKRPYVGNHMKMEFMSSGLEA